MPRWRSASHWPTILGLGSVPTGNPKIQAEDRGMTAIERSYFRVASFSAEDEFKTGSGSVRMVMWRAIGCMILDRPLTGVGAGAWEVDVPLYQVPGSQLETDFYAHNEYLQLLAVRPWWSFRLHCWRTCSEPVAHLQSTAPLLRRRELCSTTLRRWPRLGYFPACLLAFPVG